MPMRTFLFLGLVLLLAACNRNPLEVVVSRCPAVAVVGDIGTMTRFAGDGQSQDDVDFTAAITDVRSGCTEGNSVVGEMSFVIAAQAGPSLRNRVVTVPYFVAVLKDNNAIVSKKRFDARLEFGADGTASVTETLAQVIPTIEQARRYNYEVLLGFQLTPDEVVFNMRR